MSNPFNAPADNPEKGSNVQSSSSDPFEAAEASSSGKAAGPESTSQSFASPPGDPSNRPSTTDTRDIKGPPAPVQPDSMNVPIPDEPPPAYSSAPGHNTIQAGPSRMDFSGPPPMPDRFQQNQTNNYERPQIEQHITGVGYGYRPDPNSVTPQQTGFAPPPIPPPQKGGDYKGSSGSQEKPMGSQPTGIGSTAGGPSRPAPDLSPTEVATPGRPLLRKGQLLVYPKNHYCQKCGNTGYKNNDPNNSHDADWRKYGKPYNSALQASYKSSTGPYANPATQGSSNFQRPLPDLSRPPQGHPPPPPPGMGSNGGGWNQHPGNHAPPTGQFQQWGPPPPQHWAPPPPPPQIYHHNPYMGGPRLPGGLVVKPGDPRIGGRPCWKCGGEGRALSFFGFDDGPCRECRGIGRLFI